ncbi:MAG: pyridoxamine 5'-phosphate oxidase [Candidatus Eremiobacterota bacterium]
MSQDRVRAASLARDPIQQFGLWFRHWCTFQASDPDAVALATASRDGRPSVRMVLMRGFDQRGFRFYTNYGGRKAAELDSNPRAAMMFYWPEHGRQVRLEGRVERLTEAESDDYFSGRARLSQIGAWASHQSRPLSSLEELEERVHRYEERFAGASIPRPPWWGGYLLVPDTFEFWAQGPGRLHDRFQYRRSGQDWEIERLAP